LKEEITLTQEFTHILEFVCNLKNCSFRQWF